MSDRLAALLADANVSQTAWDAALDSLLALNGRRLDRSLGTALAPGVDALTVRS